MADRSKLVELPGYIVSAELVDERQGRERVRIVRHNAPGGQVDIYIETEGNHDGQVVYTLVRVPRAKFAAAIKHIGGIV
jgi:hypothetical protein